LDVNRTGSVQLLEASLNVNTYHQQHRETRSPLQGNQEGLPVLGHKHFGTDAGKYLFFYLINLVLRSHQTEWTISFLTPFSDHFTSLWIRQDLWR
jgi:hypothetical protein